MHNFFHGCCSRSYFEGWYLKHEGEDGTLCLIPAYHADANGRAAASLQILTEEGSYFLPFPVRQFRASKEWFCVQLGNNSFSDQGCALDLHEEDVELHGFLRYGSFLEPYSDVMGPFACLPLLSCKHSVWSLQHQVDGELLLNGKTYRFHQGRGYVEGDRGRSFPQHYIWTQCNFPRGCVMAAVAQMPLIGCSMPGVLASVLIDGAEYRLATYDGARVLHASHAAFLIRQGALLLQVQLLSSRSQVLRAPVSGCMEREVYASAACSVHYRCTLNGQVLLDFSSDNASFESDRPFSDTSSE